MNIARTVVAVSVLALCGTLAGCKSESKSESHVPPQTGVVTTPAASSSRNDGWRDTFSVEKAKLAASGKARYWSLEPGHTTVYKGDGGELLTIRVLPETRVVDGVTTRVIEEREEKNGRLVEISRNFFAIDAATGDVYYFGEEVDIYKNGKIASHDGAWLSGASGARFGLIMPGSPKVGDRFYNEIAPGVALDRSEIVSVDETVKTQAGTFEHCVHVKETTPLEKDVGHKWYAPGVGLIQDGDVALVSWSAK